MFAFDFYNALFFYCTKRKAQRANKNKQITNRPLEGVKNISSIQKKAKVKGNRKTHIEIIPLQSVKQHKQKAKTNKHTQLASRCFQVPLGATTSERF